MQSAQNTPRPFAPFLLTTAVCNLQVHIYNTGHHTYKNPRDPVQKAWWPFGGAWIRSHDTRLTGVYFDDCILTVDNPSNVVVVDGLWLLGAWTTTGGLMLRASDGWDYSSHPKLDGFVVKNNYLAAAPSWKEYESAYARSSFIFVDEIDGKGGALFNLSASNHLDISGNIYPNMKDMMLESGFRVQTTSSRQSLRLTDATRWVFNCSRALLFDRRLTTLQAQLLLWASHPPPVMLLPVPLPTTRT